MARACADGPDPSSVPGILSPCKITLKGAPCGRVARRWAQAPTLECDLARQDLGTYRKDEVYRGATQCSCQVTVCYLTWIFVSPKVII
jgi:hypothetical protein